MKNKVFLIVAAVLAVITFGVGFAVTHGSGTGSGYSNTGGY